MDFHSPLAALTFAAKYERQAGDAFADAEAANSDTDLISCIIAPPVKVLVIDATLNNVSSFIGRADARSAKPKPFAHATSRSVHYGE
jgi:hypothetical protein